MTTYLALDDGADICMLRGTIRTSYAFCPVRSANSASILTYSLRSALYIFGIRSPFLYSRVFHI
jgi:hypothetical protein